MTTKRAVEKMKVRSLQDIEVIGRRHPTYLLVVVVLLKREGLLSVALEASCQ